MIAGWWRGSAGMMGKWRVEEELEKEAKEEGLKEEGSGLHLHSFSPSYFLCLLLRGSLYLWFPLPIMFLPSYITSGYHS